MKKLLIGVVALVVVGAGYYGLRDTDAEPAQAGAAAGGGRPGGGGGPGARPPMTIELAAATRTPMAEVVTVVGNLEGAATVDVASKINGRLQDVQVRIGDRVSRGQQLAQVEDREILEQVRQAEASFEVGRATIRQREADLKFAETNLDRTQNLFKRNLLPRQDMDDADARHQSAAAQLDLARAQFDQAKARLDELKITLSNAEIRSPVNGFVGKRLLDPGAFVSSNTAVVSVVDIGFVRLIANIVEKDLQRVRVGTAAEVEVDAFPGDTFRGRVARVAPVLDPATRTAQMEIEVPNGDFRLKPGMYARVRLTVATRPETLTVPVNALVDVDGRKGVFTVADGKVRTAKFNPVRTGIEDGQRVEILGGLDVGTSVVTTGASALRDGDPVQLAGARPGARSEQARERSAPRPPRT
jgi:RND family efflux transporter MFP subunit